MKNLLILSLLVLTIGCTTGGSGGGTTVTPAVDSSVFDITFDGKHYHETVGKGSFGHGTIVGLTTQASMGSTTYWLSEISISTSKLYIGLISHKYIDLSSAVGTYNIAPAYTDSLEFRDIDDGGKLYTNDTTSVVTISESSSVKTSGTFNLILHRLGSTYPANGSFIIYK